MKNLIKLSGTKPERIIKGKRYERTSNTMLAIKEFNSYIASSYNGYGLQIQRAFDRMTRGMDLKEQKQVIFGEIVKRGRNRSLFLTVFNIDETFGMEVKEEEKKEETSVETVEEIKEEKIEE